MHFPFSCPVEPFRTAHWQKGPSHEGPSRLEKAWREWVRIYLQGAKWICQIISDTKSWSRIISGDNPFPCRKALHGLFHKSYREFPHGFGFKESIEILPVIGGDMITGMQIYKCQIPNGTCSYFSITQRVFRALLSDSSRRTVWPCYRQTHIFQIRT